MGLTLLLVVLGLFGLGARELGRQALGSRAAVSSVDVFAFVFGSEPGPNIEPLRSRVDAWQESQLYLSFRASEDAFAALVTSAGLSLAPCDTSVVGLQGRCAAALEQPQLSQHRLSACYVGTARTGLLCQTGHDRDAQLALVFCHDE